ncbi:MAG: hypothetical protein ACI89T_001895, partial [Cognaticolwellia sp.]
MSLFTSAIFFNLLTLNSSHLVYYYNCQEDKGITTNGKDIPIGC